METPLTFSSHKYPQEMFSDWKDDKFKGGAGISSPPQTNLPAKCIERNMSAASYTFGEVSIVT